MILCLDSIDEKRKRRRRRSPRPSPPPPDRPAEFLRGLHNQPASLMLLFTALLVPGRPDEVETLLPAPDPLPRLGVLVPCNVLLLGELRREGVSARCKGVEDRCIEGSGDLRFAFGSTRE